MVWKFKLWFFLWADITLAVLRFVGKIPLVTERPNKFEKLRGNMILQNF